MTDQLPLVWAPPAELVLELRPAGGRRHEAVSDDGTIHGSIFDAGEGCCHWYTRTDAGTRDNIDQAFAEICTTLGARTKE